MTTNRQIKKNEIVKKEREKIIAQASAPISLGNITADLLQVLLSHCELNTLFALTLVNRHLHKKINMSRHLITYRLPGLKGRDFGFDAKNEDVYCRGTYSQLKKLFMENQNIKKLQISNKEFQYTPDATGQETMWGSEKNKRKLDRYCFAIGGSLMSLIILAPAAKSFQIYCPQSVDTLPAQIINYGAILSALSCAVLTIACCKELDRFSGHIDKVPVIREELNKKISFFRVIEDNINLIDFNHQPPRLGMEE